MASPNHQQQNSGSGNKQDTGGRHSRPNRANRYTDPVPMTPLDVKGGDGFYQNVRQYLWDRQPVDDTDDSKDIGVEDAIDAILAPFDPPANGYGSGVNNILDAAHLRSRDPRHMRGRGVVEDMNGVEDQQPGASRFYDMVQEALYNGDEQWNPRKEEELFIEGMNWAALATRTEFADNVVGETAEKEKAERRTRTVLDTEDFYEPGEYLQAQRAAIAELEVGIIAARDAAYHKGDTNEAAYHEDMRLTLEDYLHYHATGHPAGHPAVQSDREAAARYMDTVETLRAKGRANLTPADLQQLTDDQFALEDQIDRDRSFALFDDKVKEVMRKNLEEKENDEAVKALETKIKDLEDDLAKRYMKQERWGYTNQGDNIDRTAYDKAVQDLLLLKARKEGRKKFDEKGKDASFNADELFNEQLPEQEKERAEKTAKASQGGGWRQALNFISHRERKTGKRGEGKWYPITKTGAVALKSVAVAGLAVGAFPVAAIPSFVIIGGLIGAQAYTWASARSGRMRFHNTEGGAPHGHGVEHAVAHASGSRRDKIRAGQAEMAKSAREFTRKERRKRVWRNVGSVATGVTGGLLFPVHATYTAVTSPKPRKNNNGGH